VNLEEGYETMPSAKNTVNILSQLKALRFKFNKLEGRVFHPHTTMVTNFIFWQVKAWSKHKPT